LSELVPKGIHVNESLRYHACCPGDDGDHDVEPQAPSCASCLFLSKSETYSRDLLGGQVFEVGFPQGLLAQLA
jgi:hypothetical protein